MSVMPFSALALQAVPQNLYPALEYALTIPGGKNSVEPEKLSALVDFVRAAAPGAGMSMESRDKATGAFHAFTVQGDLERVARYAYNPDIPEYMTMPSSVRNQMWKTPQTAEDLRRLPQALDAGEEFLTRGTEQVTITPDSHTGGYYRYVQDMAVAVFSGPTGPVLVSVSIQADPSEVGHKGRGRRRCPLELSVFRGKRSEQNRLGLGQFLYVQRAFSPDSCPGHGEGVVRAAPSVAERRLVRHKYGQATHIVNVCSAFRNLP